MDNRKQVVLKAITDFYLKQGQPISSKTLLADYPLDVSSATIRNDMKALEEAGLITKAYSSAGRVPTEQGIRFFVDWLLELSELAHGDQNAVIESYRIQRQDVEQLLQQTALLLTSLSGYAGFVLSPRLEDSRLESIVFAKLDAENALAVIVSELGILEYRVIPSRLPEDELRDIGTLLTDRLRGQRLGDVRAEAMRYAEDDDWQEPMVRNAFTLLREGLERRLERKLYIEGMIELLERMLGEGQTFDEAHRTLSLLRDGRPLSDYLEREVSEQIQARIGCENELSELHLSGLVFTRYGSSGTLGVVGPTRMDYSQAFSITSYLANRLEGILTLSHREWDLTLETEVSGG